MRSKVYQVKLKKQDKEYLTAFVKSGVKSAREIKRARILLLSDQGLKNREIAEKVEATYATICKTTKRYCEEGLEEAIKDRKRPGAPRKIHDDTKAAIIALACTEEPEGRNKWTVRLLQEKIVELEICETISRSEVQRILKKTNLSLGSKRNGASEK